MDTQTFLLKREAIQARMDDRRRDLSYLSSRHGIFGWLLKGAGFVAGLSRDGGSAASGHWLGSILWAVVLPTLLRSFKRNNESFLQRLIHTVLPFKK